MSPARAAAPPKTLVNHADCPQDGAAGDKDRAFMANKPFAEGVGGIAWIARTHRPDITHAVTARTEATDRATDSPTGVARHSPTLKSAPPICRTSHGEISGAL